MTAAVPGAAGFYGFLHRAACLLAESRQGVIFRQKTDHRLAAAVLEGGGEGGGDAGNALFNGKALFFQCLHQRRGRTDLLIGKLCVIPDLLCQRHGGIGLGGNKVFDCLDHTFDLLCLQNHTEEFDGAGIVGTGEDLFRRAFLFDHTVADKQHPV